MAAGFGPEFAPLMTAAGVYPADLGGTWEVRMGRKQGEETPAGQCLHGSVQEDAKGAGQNLQFSGKSISIRAL